MLIENPDAFKAWLTSVLEPLCDADPEALAKYVYALVRKDKSVEALHEGMVEQLDVFLQKETKPFVELLFKTLEKQEYLTPAPTIPNTNPPNPNAPTQVTPTRVVEAPEIPILKEHKPVIPVSSLPDLTVESLNGNSSVAIVPSTKPKEVVKEPVVTGEQKHKEVVRPGRIRHRSTSRNRSRSRSWDRTRRSRSRDRSREREQRRDRSRPWRNKSPPRRYERRRSPRSNSPVVQRVRSPRHNYRGRYRNRSPPRSPSRSRSRSPGTTGGNSSSSTNNSTTFHPKRRCRDFDEKGYCMRGDMCPYDHGVDPVVLEDTALGNVLTFGPNGQPPIEAAPPGGGMLPPNMVRPNPGHVMHMPHHRPMHPAMTAEYNPSAPSMWNPRSGNGAFRGGLRPGMFHGPPPGLMGPGGPPNMNLPPGAHNHVQRELISVPVMDNNIHKQQHSQMISDGMYPRTSDFMPLQDFGMKKKSGFDFNRLGPRTKNNPVNCSLELKKVPRGLNNITHLNNHFSKFGKIVNIQVNYEGDQEAALITFSSHAEANAAYKSTEAVLNNRFIKVFWHSNGEGKQENTPPVQRSVKDRLGNSSTPPQIAPPNTNKVLNLVQPKATNNLTNNNDEDKTALANNNNSVTAASHPVQKSNVYIPAKQQSADSRAQANAAIKKGQEILAQKEELKKKHEEKRKEAVKLNHELIKRQQDLLDKQLKQQNVLIDKLQKVKGDDQRVQIKEAITTLHQSISDIKNSLMEAVKNRGSNNQVMAAKVVQNRKSKDEAQKELLDAELDLITKQQEGADTSDLQKKVFELKRHAQQLGCLPIMPRRGTTMPVRIQRGFKFIRGGSKSIRSHHASPFANASVDHRPTKLLVSGYEFDEKTDVLAHFAQYGEISDYVSDDSTPSVVLNFKTRKEAEVAMLKGKHFQDRTLSVTWCTNVQLSNQLSQRRDSRSMMLSESDDDHLLDAIPEDELNIEGVDLSEEALLQDDEEEEEENEEDRSWRR